MGVARKKIPENHVKSLFDLPKLNKESAKDLRSLLDNFQKHLQALQALGQPVNSWDTLLIHILTNKFDPETFKTWKEQGPSKELPTLENLIDFLLTRCDMLESLPSKPQSFTNTTQQNKVPHTYKPNQFSNKPSNKVQTLNNSCLHTQQQQPACALCKRHHQLFKCSQFLNLSVEERKEKVMEVKVCENCLKSGHTVRQCSSQCCTLCKAFHNSLLHSNTTSTKLPTSDSSDKAKASTSPTVAHVVHKNSDSSHSQVILSTAIVNILNSNGQGVACRILLDCGSQSNFMTESTCSFLGLKRQNANIPITGINATSTRVSQRVTAKVCSMNSDFNISIDFLVIPMITNNIPSTVLDTESWNIPTELPLADPSWNSPGRIDALIGARHFWDLIQSQRTIIENSNANLQETNLGYIICGTNIPNNVSHSSLCHLTTLEDLDHHIQSFWKTEEIHNSSKVYTVEDLACEIHYSKTIGRDKDGRYIVQLPLRSKPSVLGDSRKRALRQFKSIESKLIKNLDVYEQYRSFMNEYQRLGHMQETDEDPEQIEYFLPHHAVMKESSTTTKLRVVFNASANSNSGRSLNDIQMVGPTIQDSLFSILLRFRISNYVLIADIEKMYRQTWVHPSQTNLQKIFWRDSPTDKIKTFKLLTITYGTASAPYLATRTLHQTFIDEGHQHPAALQTERDFYVDNYMTGCNTIEEGLQIQEQITSLLHRGGFHLRKWCSNNEQLLINTAPQDRETLEIYHFQDHTAHTVKTLGLVFIPNSDQFIFIVKQYKSQAYTKRTVISEIAKVYDPLGIIGPIILKAKIFMQQLWRLGLGWDETLPESIQQQWIRFRQSFTNLENMQIPRKVTVNPSGSKMQIHAFSDASESAYGTCVYIRSVDNHDKTLGSHLLCSKSRVAPLKTTSLPRLELEGALLMAQLVHTVKSSIKISDENTFYWTDSTVVLAWLNSPSSNWATYVANRVAKIQDPSDIRHWHHVSGIQNPADIISRGMDVTELINSTLWWHGPEFLFNQCQINNEIIDYKDLSDLPERRNSKSISLVTTTNSKFDILFRFSSWKKLVRVIAYCKRFINNSKTSTSQRQLKSLSLKEYRDATNTVLRLVQDQMFHKEINSISKGKELPKDNKLLQLNPILDENKLLRVGGRISNANISTDQKHPIILPANHHITKLIATDYHIHYLHCGPQALLAAIRLKFWPINGRFLVSNISRNCIKCFRAKPSGLSQIMGELPKSRVQPSRPFTHCGVDYAGPVQVKLNNLRKPIIGKAFISVFVCFSTKAIHIELVEDLSTDAFISALRRFISRRGKPSCIYSDNSTTFKGAWNCLKEIQQFLTNSTTQEAINIFTSSAGIDWRFIPPYSPNMGGLWESSIKLIKHHLRRTMGGDSLVSIPEFSPGPGHIFNKLTNYQLIQDMKQKFWARWSSEYLGELQKRSKWRTSQPNLTIGALVLLKDDNLPPLKWRLGRIVELHHGSDSHVRVVSLKTEDSITRRAISKVCLLPLDEDDTSSEPPTTTNEE